MVNKSYNQQHHHLHHKNTNPPSSTTLLPLLCRVSIKDTLNQLSSSSSSSSTTTTTRRSSKCPLKEDPNSSPKISCMGHVKRRHSTTTAKVNYKQLKNIFSSKNLLATTTPTTASAAANGVSRTKSKGRSNDHVVVPLNLAALDPPLPVVKKVMQQPCGGGEEGVSLWERRSGGARLRGLQCPLAPKRTS